MNQEDIWDEFYSNNSVAWRGNTVIPFPNSGDALDLGCGNGKTVQTLRDAGYSVTGVDFSPVAISQCRDRFGDCRFEVSSICSMPFDDDSFDYITAVHILEHLDDEHLALAAAEVSRILRPGGYVFVRSFTENDMRSKDRKDSNIFYRFYDIGTVTGAFPGFEVVDAGIKEEKTRFNTVRSRVEVLLKH